MIGSRDGANEETSLENKQGDKGCVCAALWGMIGWIGANRREEEADVSFVLYLVHQRMAGVGEQHIVSDTHTHTRICI